MKNLVHERTYESKNLKNWRAKFFSKIEDVPENNIMNAKRS